MSPDWDYLANSAVLDFLDGCQAKKRRRAFVVLKQLLDNPSLPPDAWFHDETGRKISIVRLHGLRIHFGSIILGKEVRVLDIGFD